MYVYIYTINYIHILSLPIYIYIYRHVLYVIEFNTIIELSQNIVDIMQGLLTVMSRFLLSFSQTISDDRDRLWRFALLAILQWLAATSCSQS